MSDLTAAPLGARTESERVATSRVADVKSFVSGLLFTAIVALAGTFVFTAALVVGVVGSPIIALVVGHLLVRHRRLARERAWTGWRPAAS